MENALIVAVNYKRAGMLTILSQLLEIGWTALVKGLKMKTLKTTIHLAQVATL